MREIEISEELYSEVVKAAKQSDVTLDQFVSEAVRSYMEFDPENLDHKFTPKVIAHLDRIAAEIDAGGKTYTLQEVDEHLASVKAEWLEKHAG